MVTPIRACLKHRHAPKLGRKHDQGGFQQPTLFQVSPQLQATDTNGQLEILKGLEEFREHLGGELTITLVPALGEKVEVHEIDKSAVENALAALKA